MGVSLGTVRVDKERTDDEVDLTFGHGTQWTRPGRVLGSCVGQTRNNLRLRSDIQHGPFSTAYIIEQVILKERDDVLSKRRNVRICKDRVYHLLRLLETPLDHRSLWVELSSYLLPVATEKGPYLTVSKVPQQHFPVLACPCKVNEMNTTSRMSLGKFAVCITVAETQAWFTIKIPFAAVIQLNWAVQVSNLGTTLSISPPACSHLTHL